MLHLVVLLHLICSCFLLKPVRAHSDGEADTNLITALRNDANLDLSVDEEYEDLRAELLAYHTALASLTAESSRSSETYTLQAFERGIRQSNLHHKVFYLQQEGSMLTTPCWALGGICVNHKLCTGLRYLTEVPGCKDKLNVCCFGWNRFKVRDMRDKGISVLAMPWSQQLDFGGKGILDPELEKKPKKYKKKKSASNGTRSLALIIKTKK